jgi:hypothetical protein
MAGTAPVLGPRLRETTAQIARQVRVAGKLFALDRICKAEHTLRKGGARCST